MRASKATKADEPVQVSSIAELIKAGSRNLSPTAKGENDKAAFDRFKIQPGAPVNASDVDTSTVVLGQKASMPLGWAAVQLTTTLDLETCLQLIKEGEGTFISLQCVSRLETDL